MPPHERRHRLDHRNDPFLISLSLDFQNIEIVGKIIDPQREQFRKTYASSVEQQDHERVALRQKVVRRIQQLVDQTIHPAFLDEGR